MNVLVGDLLHVEVLMPAISGVDSVSTVTSLPGLGRDIMTLTMTVTVTMISLKHDYMLGIQYRDPPETT